jgi:hypothetical protein
MDDYSHREKRHAFARRPQTNIQETEMTQSSGNVAIVTGAARGIGSA